MSATEAQAGPGAAVVSEPRDLRREYKAALKACTRAQRRWLLLLPRYNYLPYGEACRKAKCSERSVWNWLRDERVRKVREIQDEIAEQDSEISRRSILAEYAKIAFSDVRVLYDDEGRLLSPDQWPSEAAGAIAGVETVEREIRDASGKRTGEFELVRKVKLHNKLGALDFLATHKKVAGAKRIEVTGKDGEPLPGAVPVIHFVERADTD